MKLLKDLFRKKLRDVVVGDGREFKCQIPFDKKYFKFELNAHEPNPLGERYQDLLGARVWISENAPVYTFVDSIKVDDEEDDFNLRGVLMLKISIIKTRVGDMNRYEIDPKSYVKLFEQIQKYQDSYDNPDWHITFDEIRDNEMTEFTMARVKEFETPKEQGGTVFLKPNPDVLLQLADFSNAIDKVDKWSSEQKIEVEQALKKLYLTDDDISKIKEWILLDLFEVGKVKPKGNKCGIVLYGPAGTGKTLTVKESLEHIFTEILGFKFVDIPIGNIVGGERSGIVGGFAKTLADIYRNAFNYISKNKKPYVIFIDEGDDLIEDVQKNDDNNSKWLHQGQKILKNYMNPSRYPGVIFIIATNLSSPEKFYEPFRDQRLGVVHFPIPSVERYTKLFSDREFVDSLQNKLFRDFKGDLESYEVDLLAKICANKITLRITADCCERFNKTVVVKNNNFVFEDFKNYLIKYAVEQTIISRDGELDQARARGDQKSYDKISKDYSLILRDLDLLKKNLTVFEDRARRAKLEAEKMRTLKEHYEQIRKELQNLLNLYLRDADKNIVNDKDKFITPLSVVLTEINEFLADFKLDLNYNSQGGQYLNNIFEILIRTLTNIVGEEDMDGDFRTFIKIVRDLPEWSLLFPEQVKQSESRIIT